jgi:hypothetical protein
MSAASQSRRARAGIGDVGYATPEALRRLVTPGASMALGAFGMLDPLRSSLPPLYGFVQADALALRSDWGLYGMDFRSTIERLERA